MKIYLEFKLKFIFRMENSFKRYSHTINCPSIIIINKDNKYKSNVLCSENGIISITKNFFADECDLIRLKNKIISCHYSNGKIYLGNELNQLLVLDLDKKIIIKTLNDFKNPINFISSCLDLLGCTCLSNEIYFINLNDYSIKTIHNIEQDSIYHICFAPNKDYFITADQKTINIWNFNNFIQIKKIKNEINSSVIDKKIENIAWHNNGFVFALSNLNGIDFYERQSWQFKFKIKTTCFYNFISFSPRGHHLLAACDSFISIYKLSTLRQELKLSSLNSMINSIIWYENKLLFTNRVNGSLTMIKLDLFKSLPHDLKDQLSDKEIALLALE